MLELARPDDREAVNLLAKQVHAMHVAWRPDIYEMVEELYPEARFLEAMKQRQLYVAKLDGTVVLPGTGDGHVPEIISKYVAQGGNYFTLEPHLSEFVGLSELEQANNKSLVGHMTFATPEAAFDAAAQNLVKILNNL